MRLARRCGDEVACYSEAKGYVEVHGPEGMRRVEIGSDAPHALHQHFGVSESVLRAHFAASSFAI